MRVSSSSQSDNTSQSIQLDALQDTVESINGTIINTLEGEESAAEIERSQLNQVLEMAKNDEYDILAVYEVDRLSRADPWDTVRYLTDLQRSGITLYCDSHGFIDWDDHYDFEILTREAVFANRWLNRLQEGRVDGVTKYLKSGEWPLGGEPPMGYYTDDKNKLRLNDAYAEIIPEMFEIYVETKNREETKRQINSKLEQAGLPTITYPQVKTTLTSQLVLGRLEYSGEVVATDSKFKIVEESIFNQVQALLGEQGTRSESTSKPDFLEAAVDRFGVDFVMELIDSFKPFSCRSCDGNLERHGSTEVWGINMPNYRCQKCNYQGALINESELNKLHQTLPLRCPYCTAAEEFDARRLREAGSKFEYQYTCNVCEYTFGSDMQPDKLRRMLNHPALKFSITDRTEDRPNDDSDDNQHSIGDFS